jgi:RNA polymerase primary sigma factor
LKRNPKQLFKRAQSGDIEARNQLIEDNIRLIGAVVKRHGLSFAFKNAGFTNDDIINTGVLGLIKAIEKFQYKQGTFATYAWHWIRQCLMGLLQDHTRLVRIPRKAQTLWNSDAAGRTLKPKERKHLEWARENIERGYGDLLEAVDNTKHPIERAQYNEELILVTRALARLPARESFIIRACYLHGRTLADVGQELKLTKERIRQIRDQTIGKLQRLCGVYNE